jgi:uncharacterized membrane protein
MAMTLSKHRTEGLTDGIFAIVMTLLVLELKVPELERHASNQEILAKLSTMGPQLFAFFLTFSLAALFWFLHHASMQFIKHMTRGLIMLNLLFLMLVSLLPFSAAMLGRFQHAPIALEIYYAHQLALSILMAVQWEVVRHKDLTTDSITARDRTTLPIRLWSMAAACLGALVFAVIRPEWAQGVFLAGVVAGRLIAKWQSAAAAQKV